MDEERIDRDSSAAAERFRASTRQRLNDLASSSLPHLADLYLLSDLEVVRRDTPDEGPGWGSHVAMSLAEVAVERGLLTADEAGTYLRGPSARGIAVVAAARERRLARLEGAP